jgi:predicted amidohydrolase YtcJ
MNEAMPTRAADTIVVADRAITVSGVEPAGPTAVVIQDGVIHAVVPREAAARYAGPDTVVLDAGHRTLMPGFVDPHAHFEVAARTRHLTVDCRAPGCEGIPDVLDALRDGLGDARDGWVVGQGNLFFDRKMKERRFPTRAELDSVSRDVPIALRAGGHVTVLNSKALELAGIDDAYRAVDYSITGKPTVERDPSGAATGLVKEMDRLLPFPRVEGDELRDAILDGLPDLFTRYGVTTMGEISETPEGLAIMDGGHVSGQLGTRVHVYLWVPGTTTLEEACAGPSWLRLQADRSLMRVHGIKVFADGGYSAASAAMRREYALHGHGCGEMAMTRDQIAETVLRASAAGLQVAIHANGDRAQAEVCAAIAGVRAQLPPGAPRTRLEHAGNFLPDYEQNTQAWRAAGIIPVPQPVFLHNFAEFLPEYVGEYARRNQFPFRRLLDDGWPISGSCDVWVGSEQMQTNPFFSIACCVTRRAFHGSSIDIDQAISVEEAIAMHTIGGATAMGEQGTRGSLEPGKLADVLVLDRDPRTVSGDELTAVQVDEVLLGGRSVFTRHEHSNAPALGAHVLGG